MLVFYCQLKGSYVTFDVFGININLLNLKEILKALDGAMLSCNMKRCEASLNLCCFDVDITSIRIFEENL